MVIISSADNTAHTPNNLQHSETFTCLIHCPLYCCFACIQFLRFSLFLKSQVAYFTTSKSAMTHNYSVPLFGNYHGHSQNLRKMTENLTVSPVHCFGSVKTYASNLIRCGNNSEAVTASTILK